MKYIIRVHRPEVISPTQFLPMLQKWYSDKRRCANYKVRICNSVTEIENLIKTNKGEFIYVHLIGNDFEPLFDLYHIQVILTYGFNNNDKLMTTVQGRLVPYIENNEIKEMFYVRKGGQ